MVRVSSGRKSCIFNRLLAVIYSNNHFAPRLRKEDYTKGNTSDVKDISLLRCHPLLIGSCVLVNDRLILNVATEDVGFLLGIAIDKCLVINVDICQNRFIA